ncbi:trans-resveratrol di-O-methyltransferase-like [Camellia sinensis]|uniref:trans-resveratrol di-O-methyltransferase-like n=1 Tax=Camellia sinensis TaxID=4442 RepID=UPI00103683BB|nr:trans-resveratrol di-O-methyltransferase-like [Camellia sinensis]
MDLHNGQLGARELFQAQSHIYKHAFSFANSMSLSCAVQLGIPDIIHNHKKPISLPDIVSSLQLPPSKINALHRLMSLLTHLGFFASTKLDPNHGDQEGYVLIPSSRLLIKSELPNLSPLFQTVIDPSDYQNSSQCRTFLFNEGMASDSRMMGLVIRSEAVFGGLNSLVHVGGGTGIIAQIISEAFPSIKCTDFDLPHVVENLPEGKNLNYVGGHMFQSFPSANAIFFKVGNYFLDYFQCFDMEIKPCLYCAIARFVGQSVTWLKCVLHNWSDEDCVKILKRCREAIPSKEGGKLEIKPYQTGPFMMVLAIGRERSEKEWEKIFLEAGFSHYKITPIFGLRSLIEVYPQIMWGKFHFAFL